MIDAIAAPILSHSLAPGRNPKPLEITSLKFPPSGGAAASIVRSARPAAIHGADDKPSDDPISPPNGG